VSIGCQSQWLSFLAEQSLSLSGQPGSTVYLTLPDVRPRPDEGGAELGERLREVRVAAPQVMDGLGVGETEAGGDLLGAWSCPGSVDTGFQATAVMFS
jgi:hypothetical protein